VANIRTSRKSGFTVRSGVRRRETLWMSTDFTTTNLAVSGVALLTSLNAAALALRPFTIVRARGTLFAASDQTIAAENYDVSLGHAVVSAQAVAIGVTAVPTPVTDLSSDLWYLYENILGRLESGSDVAFTDVGHLLQYDSRAMRKVEDGEDIITVIESSAFGGGLVVQTQGRTLIKLH